MARGRYFTDFERDLIRVGVAMNKNASEIARALNRTDTGVRQQIKAMDRDGTLNDLPLPFTFEEVRGAAAHVS